MARTFAGQSGRSGKPLSSVKKANAAGYAKRLARRPKTGLLADVYEHQQQKVRRDKVKLAFDRDELAELGLAGAGSDDDGDRDALRARLIGENADDEMIDSDDDEEIDSDAAFDASDDEQFAGFSFHGKVRGVLTMEDACAYLGRARKAAAKKSKRKAEKVRLAEVDLNEDTEEDAEGGGDGSEEEEDEGEPSEFFDVLDVLDGRGAEATEDTSQAVEEGRGGKVRDGAQDGLSAGDEDDESEGADESEEDEEEREDGMGELSADEEGMNEDAVEGLGRFVASLETGSKRKADEGTDDGAPRRKRRIILERTQAGPEGEFTAYNSAYDLSACYMRLHSPARHHKA
jgi:U3 small nucleolar RNA-associated protein 14